ncbi:hypothetical protein [Nocardia pseudovaccinii]|uniref:hypothetical protein n=1 Tax=Nocardia pseudovaccinii TaxID=189540 RepID=UPI000AB2F121|nr:hypothetical protein [Nocardia pseudovaccinii]
MLVVNERAAVTRSEQCVLDWMRTWTGQYVIVGLAISGWHRPDRDSEETVREAGLVVFTPRAMVVIEAEEAAAEVATGVSGQADGRSRLLQFQGDPVPARDCDTSPFDRVTSHVLDLEELVRKRHPDAFIDGLVVVVPPRDASVMLDIEASEHGNCVVLGSSAGLRAWFHRTANRKLIWTAEQVHALLGELHLSHVVTVENLAAEGFPSESGRRMRSESRALVGAARASAPLAAISASVDSSSVAAGRPHADGLSEPRFESALARPSDITEVLVDDHSTTADNSTALVEAVSLSKHDGPQSVSTAIVDRGTVSTGPQPLSAPPTAPYPPWLSADIARAQARGAQRSRLAVRSDAGGSHVSVLPAEPEPIAAVDADQAQSAPPASSPYADEWSSWVDSDPQAIPTPPQTEPEPLRAPTPPAAERSNQDSARRRVPAVRTRTSAAVAKGLELIPGLPQHLATLLIAAVVVGTIWILVSAGVNQRGSGVQPHLVPNTETVAPPELPAPARQAEPQCFPFQPGC